MGVKGLTNWSKVLYSFNATLRYDFRHQKYASLKETITYNHWQHLSQVIIITIIIIIIIIIITVLVHVIHDRKTRSEAFHKLRHNQ